MHESEDLFAHPARGWPLGTVPQQSDTLYEIKLRNSQCYDCHVYGVATVSRIDKIIGFFCRISSLL